MIASSVSSSRIRLRAARSSADSAVETPGRSPVDAVLADPGVQTPGADAELVGDLLDLLAGTNERHGSLTKLWRVGTRHDAQPSKKALDSSANRVTNPWGTSK